MARSRGQSFRKGRRKGFRRQFGLDRSGPPPRQTRPGEPLRPWTIPNAVGYIRLAALPVFLYLAFSSGDGRDPAAAVLRSLGFGLRRRMFIGRTARLRRLSYTRSATWWFCPSDWCNHCPKPGEVCSFR